MYVHVYCGDIDILVCSCSYLKQNYYNLQRFEPLKLKQMSFYNTDLLSFVTDIHILVINICIKVA